MKAPEGYAPTQEAQREFLHQFSLLISKIETCRLSQNIPKSPCKLVSKL